MMEIVEAAPVSPVFEGGLDATRLASSYLNAAGIHNELRIAGDGKPDS